jgi:protoporphyrinogen oxidase
MWKPISRSQFLKALAACTVAAASGKYCLDSLPQRKRIPCRLLGPSRVHGHKLRDVAHDAHAAELSADELIRKQVVIIGAGMAGLSAAWWLQKHGVTDFVVLELEPHPGGNSASGHNQYSAYPWGAHYVPLANDESDYVRMLFEELSIIKGWNTAKQPIYEELYLCHDPQERLFKDGSFQEGLVPKRGLQPFDQDQIAQFFQHVIKLRTTTGTDGKPVFAIPLDLSSQDQEYRSLDKLSMSAWLKQQGFSSKPLLWYVNYCCRDDYGSSIENVSAWAGLHYFAGRRGTAANAEANAVVTWPEGNGFLVNKLKEKLGQHIVTDSLAMSVHPGMDKSRKIVSSLIVNTKNGKRTKYVSDYVIVATPRFVASHILPNSPATTVVKDLAYAPWMVANITVRKVPHSSGEALAWDNVSYYSDSLGYVVATHQDISTRPNTTVLTYYYPLSDMNPSDGRRNLYTADPDHWSKLIVDDLEKMHQGISDQIESIDLWPWAHGMVRPSVGFIWGESRSIMGQPFGNVFFAHSDMSGISNFEEAQYHGVEAARRIMEAANRTA